MTTDPFHGLDDADTRAGIPDELVDAALDGEVSDELHDEIVRAMKYDRPQRERVSETLDAIDAMRDMDGPDLRLGVLNRLDRRRVFLPGAMRRAVRAGRLGVAAAILLTLTVISGIQSLSPRFATLAPHETPVRDIASALGDDGRRAADALRDEARRAHAVAGHWALLIDPGVLGARVTPVDRASGSGAAPEGWPIGAGVSLLAAPNDRDGRADRAGPLPTLP